MDRIERLEHPRHRDLASASNTRNTQEDPGPETKVHVGAILPLIELDKKKRFGFSLQVLNGNGGRVHFGVPQDPQKRLLIYGDRIFGAAQLIMPKDGIAPGATGELRFYLTPSGTFEEEMTRDLLNGTPKPILLYVQEVFVSEGNRRGIMRLPDGVQIQRVSGDHWSAARINIGWGHA